MKDGDLVFHFDKIEEAGTHIGNTSLKHLLINNHEIVANRGKIKCHLPLEHIFGFCKTHKKLTKQLGFHLTLKTADLQDMIYTTIVDDITVSIDKLFLNVQILIPDAETRMMFNN